LASEGNFTFSASTTSPYGMAWWPNNNLVNLLVLLFLTGCLQIYASFPGSWLLMYSALVFLYRFCLILVLFPLLRKEHTHQRQGPRASQRVPVLSVGTNSDFLLLPGLRVGTNSDFHTSLVCISLLLHEMTYILFQTRDFPLWLAEFWPFHEAQWGSHHPHLQMRKWVFVKIRYLEKSLCNLWRVRQLPSVIKSITEYNISTC
jgi:hypothetical protein